MTEEQKVATVSWTVPAGAVPGQEFELQTPHGFAIKVQVPAGVAEGTTLQQSYYYMQSVADAVAAAADTGVEVHPSDVITSFVEGGTDVSSGGPVEGETEGKTYHNYEAPIYGIGFKMKVTRSSGDESDCVVQAAWATAMGPQYEVAWQEEGGTQTKIVDASQLTFVSGP
mmetsp:Transcript_55620/g.178446  ORF Transcript_55620/g.178446 Transcript_55620/m.178446 type:complete len:170 (-) Transcript_55620:85-594(-)